MLKKGLWGYNKKQVEELLEVYEDMIAIQKKDIQYLKQDNAELKNTLFEISTELAQNDVLKTKRQ